MSEVPVSEELRDQLNGQKTLGTMVGAIKPNWMKWANDLLDREEEIVEDHSPSGGEEFRPNVRPRVRRIPGPLGWWIIDCEGA